jgi:adenosylcobinamide-phosphate synthase
MVNFLWLTAGALLLDKAVGDPSWIPHPVIWMGRWIAWWESVLNRPNWRQCSWAKWSGCFLTVATTGLFGFGTWFVLFLLKGQSPLLAVILQTWLISTTIAWNGLVKAGRKVAEKLHALDLTSARSAVAEVVGRDTGSLSEREVTRAAVETIAENLVDAVVSPIFFAAIGGAPLAVIYRAVNTLDSMVGHKNEQYLYFGWASARLDDVMNFIPARITAVLLFTAALAVRSNARLGWLTYRKDARKHPSPNSGIPEAFVAGALQVQLGGLNYYKGKPSLRPCLGLPSRELEKEDISRTILLVNTTAVILLFCLMLGGFLVWLL